MNATEVQPALLSDAVQAVRLGQRMLAREILAGIIQIEPKNEHAFAWMAAIAESREEAILLLEHVLEINPRNSFVANTLGVQRLNSRPASVPTPIDDTWMADLEVTSVACLVCKAERTDSGATCGHCGAAYTLLDLPSVLANGGANERRIEEAVARWLAQLESQPTLEALMGVGLGYLSINRSGDALPFLLSALKLNPSEAILQDLCESLAERRLILAVDDSTTVRRLVSITLERQGHRVRTAVHGVDGLAKFHEETPDLVLLDLTMPQMDGYELCKTIRRSPGGKNLPIIMLSGNDGVFDKVRGKMAGTTDYLTKPFQRDVLLETITKYWQSAESKGSVSHGKNNPHR